MLKLGMRMRNDIFQTCLAKILWKLYILLLNEKKKKNNNNNNILARFTRLSEKAAEAVETCSAWHGYGRTIYRRADKGFEEVVKFMLTSRRWHCFVLLAYRPEKVLWS